MQIWIIAIYFTIVLIIGIGLYVFSRISDETYAGEIAATGALLSLLWPIVLIATPIILFVIGTGEAIIYLIKRFRVK